MVMTLLHRLPLLLGLCLSCGGALAAGTAPGDDSVHAWGRWDQLIAPAAGPGLEVSPAQLLPQAALELRPEDSGALSPGLQQTGGGGTDNNGPGGPDFPVLIPGTGEQPPGSPIDRGPRPGDAGPILIPGTDAGQPPGSPIDRGPRGEPS